MIRRVAAAALLVLALGVAWAGEEKDPGRHFADSRQIADEFLVAFRAGDEKEMTFLAAKTAEQGCFDPFLVVHDLLALHADAAIAEPPRADDALEAARALAARVTSRPRNAALPAIVDGWRALTTDDLRREAGLLRAHDETMMALRRGETAACVADIARLRSVAADGATDVGRSRLLWQVADVLGRSGRMRESIETRREIETMAERASWPSRQAGAVWQQGYDEYKCGEVRTARELWRREVELLDAMGERGDAAESLLFIADAHVALGEYGEALRHSERALAIAEATGREHVAALALTEVASFHALLGDAARALPMLEDARGRFGPGSVTGSAWALALIGRTYAGLGLLDRAAPAYEQAIAEMETLRGYAADRARYRGELGRVYAEMGRLDRALELQERAWRDLDAAGQRIDAAEALARLGELQTRRGEHDRAVQTIGRVLGEMEAMGNRGAAARARAGLGRALSAAGDEVGALRAAEASLSEMETLGDRIGASRVLRDLAGSSRRLGRPLEAMTLARRAVETPMALGTGLGEEEATGLRRDARAAADEGILAARDLLAGPSADGARAAAEAYWFAESSRGLLLAHGIVNRDALFDAAVSPELRDADAAARDRVAALRNRLTELASNADADPAPLLAARADLDAAYRGLGESTARVQREARRVADVVYPRPVSLPDLQASLDPGTAMALYHMAPGHALAVVVAHDSVRLVDLGDTAALTARVQDYVDVVSVEGSADEEKAAALYDALLRPLEPETLTRRRILVSPDGPLAFLPIEALQRRADGRRERVLERWETAYVPSATVSVVLRRELSSANGHGVGIVALGDPVYPGEESARGTGLRRFGRLRRLPGTAAEVRSIGELVPTGQRTLLVRETATGAALTRALASGTGRLAALHLACHGRVDAAMPRLTGLVLTGGQVLSVDDIYRMRVPADLVVLSACDTGRGTILVGEGAVNLVRGFLFAGASRVVVSDWAVCDDTTRSLMVAFYGRMLRDRLPPGEALRAAKLEMLRSGGASAHPAHWAAFVLWGG